MSVFKVCVESSRAHMDMSHMDLARDVFICAMSHRYGLTAWKQKSNLTRRLHICQNGMETSEPMRASGLA